MDEKKSQYSMVLVLLIAICVAVAVACLYANGALERFELFTQDHRFNIIRIPSMSLFKSVQPLQKKSKCDVILIDMPESAVTIDAGPSLKDCATAIAFLTPSIES